MTHDLSSSSSRRSAASVDRVVVTELNDGTFFADLVMERDGEEVAVSARPSDAIALAARTDAPRLRGPRRARRRSASRSRTTIEEEEIERFREFLEDVTPEDFEHPDSRLTTPGL